MAHACPKDGASLQSDARYGEVCGRCQAVLVSDEALEARHPTALSLLTVETDERSPVFALGYQCPGCRHMLAPWRIPASSAHALRCTACGWCWLPRHALDALLRQHQKKAAADAYRAMPEAERKQLAHDLAASEAAPPSLSPFHALLAVLGLPVVSNIDRRRTPVLTWCLAGALIAAFVAQYFADGGVLGAVDSLGYRSADPSLWAAVRAVFLHAGIVHLCGNLYFLLAFGDGVEQRMGRPAMLAAFVGAGALTLVIDGWCASRPTLIVGASGGIAVLIGACIVLQRQARVVTSLAGFAFRVSIVAYGVIELGYQTLMSLVSVAGVAWIAHLSGLIVGVALGLVLRGRQATFFAARR
jgi:membrane associated rhomboid family serine protease